MQFIEKNSFNIRSAIYHFKKQGNKLEFILYPMIHIGSKEYYQDVYNRLSECNLILLEGVNSKKVNLLTRTYRIVSKVKRIGLTTQEKGLNILDFKDRIYYADVDTNTFDTGWSSLPTKLRLKLAILIPLYTVYLFFSGTRNSIATQISVDDLPSRRETLIEQDYIKLENLVVDERDIKLIKKIEEIYNSEHDSKYVVGILYGARHMRAVVKLLNDKLNYTIVKSEWINVFNL